jgi:hypothetical protein
MTAADWHRNVIFCEQNEPFNTACWIFPMCEKQGRHRHLTYGCRSHQGLSITAQDLEDQLQNGNEQWQDVQ